jgi:ketosteroid isomerase-like protein
LKTLVASLVLILAVPASGSAHMNDEKAVSIIRAHIEAWSNYDYDTARKLLSPDVHVTVTSTQPMMARTDTMGVDQYMAGLEKFAQAVRPGSAQIIESSGDECPDRGEDAGSFRAARNAGSDCHASTALPAGRQRQDKN